jgi:hypothetical protein
MTVKVKHKLTKTMMHPEYDLTYKHGVIISSLDDDSGLYLVDFGFCQWYVHENDFHLDY